MTLADRNNFEKAYNRLSHIISTIDNCNNKEALKDKLEIVLNLLENVKLD